MLLTSSRSLLSRPAGRAALCCHIAGRQLHSSRRASMLATAAGASAGAATLLAATPDLYGGLVIDASALPSDPLLFGESLGASVKAWQSEGRRGLWLKLPIDRASLAGPAVEHHFRPHHAEATYIMLVRWLPETESTIPPNASHQMGVGAVVINRRPGAAPEILMVMENNGPLKGKGVWKVPTGIVDAGEDLHTAAEREVLEETGIRAKFDCVLAIRQAHGFAHGKSDMFLLLGLVPEPGQDEVRPCEVELEAAKWMSLTEYVDQPFQKGVALYDTIRDRVVKYAEGRYKGWRADKVDGSSSQKSRRDLLLVGDCDLRYPQ